MDFRKYHTNGMDFLRGEPRRGVPPESIGYEVVEAAAERISSPFTNADVQAIFRGLKVENYYRAADKLIKRMARDGYITFDKKRRVWLRLYEGQGQ